MAAIFKRAVSTRHAGVEEGPALSAVEMFFPGLLLAIRPPCLVLGPLLLRGIPLLLCPDFDARRSGGCGRGRWGSRLRFGCRGRSCRRLRVSGGACSACDGENGCKYDKLLAHCVNFLVQLDDLPWRLKKAPGRALFNFVLISLLAEVPAAVLATEKCPWLADEAIANGIPVIVTAVVAVIVGI
jgi:hypothetical protein